MTFHPLVALDVAGHEMSHGVTSRTAALRYKDESGGLNESTSDIFGTAVEFFSGNANDPGDYVIGEEVFTTYDPANNFIRRMDQPSRDGRSADFWFPGIGHLDVHQSSGVGNHWFYADARTGSIQAATDLYGAGSTEAAAVAIAWTAVNVL